MKLENEIVQDRQNETSQTNEANQEILKSNNLETESVVEDSTVNEMEKSFTQEAIETGHEIHTSNNNEDDFQNDLKEFGVDSDSPDLFSSETENSSPEDLFSSENEEEDDLQIPAFLRRQKKLMVFKELNGRRHNTNDAEALSGVAKRNS